MLKTATMAAALLLAASSLAIAQTSSTSRSSTSPPSGSTTGAAGSSMMSESQLKQQLERQGYSDIELHQDTATTQQGDWSGTAKKGSKQVTIHVDPSGKVTER